MKRAFGILELLIVIVIITVLYFSFIAGPKVGRKNPFDDNVNLQSQEDIIETKMNDIQNTKNIKERIEKNLQEGTR